MKLLAWLDDIFYLVGCAFILVFVYKTAPVYCWLVGGMMCIGLAILIGMGARRPE